MSGGAFGNGQWAMGNGQWTMDNGQYYFICGALDLRLHRQQLNLANVFALLSGAYYCLDWCRLANYFALPIGA